MTDYIVYITRQAHRNWYALGIFLKISLKATQLKNALMRRYILVFPYDDGTFGEDRIPPLFLQYKSKTEITFILYVYTSKTTKFLSNLPILKQQSLLGYKKLLGPAIVVKLL